MGGRWDVGLLESELERTQGEKGVPETASVGGWATVISIPRAKGHGSGTGHHLGLVGPHRAGWVQNLWEWKPAIYALPSPTPAF